MAYDIELRRLKNTDNNCLRLDIEFALSAAGPAQDAEIAAIREEVRQLDKALEQGGVKLDFGRAVVLDQGGRNDLWVSGVMEIPEPIPCDSSPTIERFAALAEAELHHAHQVLYTGVERYLHTPRFFPDFLKV